MITQNLKIKTCGLLIILILILNSVFIIISSPAYAQSSTDRPQRPMITSPGLEKMREKMADFDSRREATKPGELQREMMQKIRSHAWAGVIKTISGQSIFIATKNGAKQVNVSDQTKIFKMPGRTSIGLADLKVDDFIAAMGPIEGNIMDARLILQTPAKKPQMRRHAVHGIVQEINGQTLILKHQRQDKIFNVTLNSETKIKIKGMENPSFSDIKVGNRVVATCVIENEVLIAKHLFVIPGKARGLEDSSSRPARSPKLSTPSAE